jgi:hypothetical protein
MEKMLRKKKIQFLQVQ